MSRKQCLCIVFVIPFWSIAEGGTFINNEPSWNIPAEIRGYVEEHFAALTSDLTSRLEELEKRHTQDRSRIDVLERVRDNNIDQIMNMRRDLDDIRRENNRLKERVNTVENLLHRQTLTGQTEVNTTVFTQNTSEEGPRRRGRRLGKFRSRWTGSNHGNSTNRQTGFRKDLNEDEIRGGDLNRSARVGPTSNVVAFHAALGQTLSGAGTGHPIAFDNVITLVGGHYSKNTGVFTCLREGVYAFQWSHRVSSANAYMFTELVKNGQFVDRAISYHATIGSSSAIVELTVGDEVWVKVTGHTNAADVELLISKFSGFLIN
ncbi:complement C1q tumor necrosis factor-related protein 2-like [Pecten maximus]|uniref:complement C1q tumor necrosis factor-related protein 2-like n=1 Tax=Pecten maximus TaxID=6579 RepID=UPI0014580BBE|nr:complement C1q tumor necrosis factor-related protein 2-like [Pecten maximus]